jgi:large subunit ribosomal protein L24
MRGRCGNGASLNARVQLADVAGAALRYRGLSMPEGKVALQMTLSGQGRSAAGLTGALSGAGTLTVIDAHCRSRSAR